MSYEAFQAHIKGLVAKVDGLRVRFLQDTEHGKFCAVCSDGSRFFANPLSVSITAQWGTGHQARFVPAAREGF